MADKTPPAEETPVEDAIELDAPRESTKPAGSGYDVETGAFL